jgi:hypothetical protein
MSTASLAKPKEHKLRPALNPRSPQRKRSGWTLIIRRTFRFSGPLSKNPRGGLRGFRNCSGRVPGPKALGTCLRALKLSRILQFVMGRAPLCWHLSCSGFPSVLLIDYEFTAILPGIKPTWMLVSSLVRQQQMKNWFTIAPVPVHLQKAYARYGFRPGDFPAAERLAEKILSLPVYPQLSVEQQQRVVHEIAQFLTARLSCVWQQEALRAAQ